MRRTRVEPIHGLLLLDKPPDLTSHQAVVAARQALAAESAGHTGTLDPLATGMLPIAFGLATRLAGWMLDADKAYRVRARLGFTTDTFDSTGKVQLERPLPADWAQLVPGLLPRFTGAIQQVPPQFSALKRGGEPIYKLARAGVEVPLDARPVQVHALELLATGPDWMDLEVHCGKGTYIRSLVADLGEALGCGAHVIALHRLWVAPFSHSPMTSLATLNADRAAARAALLPPQAMIPQLPRLEVGADVADRLLHGQRIAGYRKLSGTNPLAVLHGDTLIGLVSVDERGVLRPLRILKP